MRRAAAGSVTSLLIVAACTSTHTSPSSTPRAATPRRTTASIATASVRPPAPPTAPARSASTAASPPIPPLSAKAHAVGLRDIRTIVPDAIVDLRYATADNFVGTRLYPRDARCLVHQSMAHGLAIAARTLRRAGYLLVFWDCYRPHTVQVHMFEIVPNPNWVARPGPYATSHESGRSVDVTLARRARSTHCVAAHRVQDHCLLPMGTGFDNFTPRAYAYATAGVSATAQANRARLRRAMAAGGIVVYSGEWWHFDGPGALVERPILGAPLH